MDRAEKGTPIILLTLKKINSKEIVKKYKIKFSEVPLL